MRLGALVDKGSLLAPIVIGCLAQVLILSLRWPIAATITTGLNWGFGCIDRSNRGGALRPRAAGVAIATILIALILLVVLARSLALVELRAMRRHGSCLVGAERKGALVPGMILSTFQSGAVASEAAIIYLADLEKKVQGGLALSCDSLSNGLVPDVFLATFLLVLGMGGGP